MLTFLFRCTKYFFLFASSKNSHMYWRVKIKFFYINDRMKSWIVVYWILFSNDLEWGRFDSNWLEQLFEKHTFIVDITEFEIERNKIWVHSVIWNRTTMILLKENKRKTPVSDGLTWNADLFLSFTYSFLGLFSFGFWTISLIFCNHCFFVKCGNK